MKPLIGLCTGLFLGYILKVPADNKFCAVIIFAAIDSLCGGLAAKLNLNFSNVILISGFFTNLIFGFVLIFIGNILELDLYYIALFLFGLQIFKNFSLMKQFLLKKFGV